MVNEGAPRKNIEAEAQHNLELLRQNPYPGRGIILGLSESGEQAVQVYWLMGRSDNSRNRILVSEGETVKTQAFDESKVEDPSLIIYNALRVSDGNHIVTNGDQTDTIAAAIQESKDVKDAIRTREYEPDKPNYTPRISGITTIEGRDFKNIFSIISRGDNGNPEYYFQDSKPERGVGQCFHTYEGDGNPLPSFKSAPYSVPLKGSIDEIADTYWETLNEDNKVSLVVKTIDLEGRVDYRIKNKLEPKN